MALNKEQEKQLADLFQSAPAWTQKPDFHANLAAHGDEQQYAAGDVIFARDQPADLLSLIAEGEVVQTYGPWFRKTLGRGDFLGRQAIFVGLHQSTARAVTMTRVYHFSAVDVRILLEKYDELRDFLLQEVRASRLRSLPIFESLGDEDIRWLAHLTEPYKVGAESVIPLNKKPGLHIVDWGQVAVAGPAAGGQDTHQLSSGNFFFTPGIPRGALCAAEPRNRAHRQPTVLAAGQPLPARVRYVPQHGRSSRRSD